MVSCPILGEAVIARIIPVFSLKSDLLFDQVQKLITIIHEIGAYVLLVMTDNLHTNVSCFKMFHENYGSVSEFSVNHPVPPCTTLYHPVPNEVFKVLYTLFDPIHLFKNLKYNWLTEKVQKLKFYVLEGDKTAEASWSDIVHVYNAEKTSLMKESKLD